MEKRFVYADNAATTKVSKPVLDVMMPYFTEEYGNASIPKFHNKIIGAAAMTRTTILVKLLIKVTFRSPTVSYTHLTLPTT